MLRKPISGYGGCVPDGPSRSCQPLPSAGITLHHWYYELVRLPECRLYYLAVYRLDRAYSTWENTPGLPSSHNIHLIPCNGLRPRRARITLPCPRAPCYIPRPEIRTIGDESAAFRQMNNVGLRNDENFVAQSLYLRCSPVSHPPGFTTACYQTRCKVQF